MRHDSEKSAEKVAKIAIIEGDVNSRKEWTKVLTQWPAYRVTGEFGSGEEALEKLPGNPPNFVLVDIELPGMSGIECTRELKRALPDLEILMFTMLGEWDRIFDALRAGASGYLLKNTRPDDLKSALEELEAGGAPMTPSIARKVVQYFQNTRLTGELSRGATQRVDWVLESLSPKENDVLKLLSEGCSYTEISCRMEISLNTVRTYIRRTYEKLQVQSRTEAVIKYLSARDR
jgi:DNA-binding NarL/FixJ family response regulator